MEPAKQQQPQQQSESNVRVVGNVKARPGKRWMILGLAVLAVLLGIGAYAWATHGKESTDDAQVEADVVPLSTRVAGQVKRLAAQDNAHVKKGDLILELDDADFAARVQQAEAEVETAAAQAAAADAQAQVTAAGARGGFTSAQAGVTGSSAQVATAKAGLSRAEAEEHKASLELQRSKDLRAANVVPQAKLDEDQAAYDVARAALLQAQANLDAAQSRIGEARGRLSQSSPVEAAVAAAQANARLAHARQKSAEAMLALARLQLSYTKLYAQEDGQVTRLTAREGQMVQPGQPVASLVPDRTYVVANFKETQIGDMKPGQEVEIDVDAFPGKTLKGKVESLAGGTGARFSLLPPDNASGNFVKVVQRVPVRIAWVDVPADVALRPGLSADVAVRVK
ncbi:MAG TPA: HlyD family secretion protein [Myxococcales bacterium]|jgi:membrane fusion protein (multidrug efflux system)|nr:HlyD family secretion protein [Myxococcales bacterium]